MSLHFEIEKTARDLLLLYGDRLATPKGRIHASTNLVAALMPLVERAVREGALQMAGMCVAEFAPTIEMPSTMLIERADAIVAGILK